MASKTIHAQFAERYAALSEGARSELGCLLNTPWPAFIAPGGTADERGELYDTFGVSGFNHRSYGDLWRLSRHGHWLLTTLPKDTPS